jgi:protein SCO1
MIPPWGRWGAGVMAFLLLGAFAFATIQPVQVLPRIRLAPGFAFVDQAGLPFTSDATRGEVVLYGFAYGDCGSECDSVRDTMAEIAARADTEIDLGDTEFRMVTVSIDPVSDSNRLPELAESWGADGERWRWATGDDPEALRTVLSSGFELYHQQTADGSFAFDSRYVLVDGWGVIRGEYRYSTLAEDADKIVRHVGLLGEEIRNSKGVTSVAYEAAHLFMCYP